MPSRKPGDVHHVYLNLLLNIAGLGFGDAKSNFMGGRRSVCGELFVCPSSDPSVPPRTDFRRPEAVLGSLNQAFQMENQNGLYFTIWYGVYHHPTGTLRYASAGHPPPIVVSGAKDERGKAESLPAIGCPVGILPDFPYASKECTIAGPARLFLFSDGAYEIVRPDGTILEFEAFEEILTRAVPEGSSELQELLQFAREVHGSEELDDDFSIIKMTI